MKTMNEEMTTYPYVADWRPDGVECGDTAMYVTKQ